jgi:hypothetical protein
MEAAKASAHAKEALVAVAEGGAQEEQRADAHYWRCSAEPPDPPDKPQIRIMKLSVETFHRFTL